MVETRRKPKILSTAIEIPHIEQKRGLLFMIDDPIVAPSDLIPHTSLCEINCSSGEEPCEALREVSVFLARIANEMHLCV